MGQESSTPIDDNIPSHTLKQRTLEAVAEYIKDGHAKKIVVLVSFVFFKLRRVDQNPVTNFHGCIKTEWCWNKHLSGDSGLPLPRYRPIRQLGET